MWHTWSVWVLLRQCVSHCFAHVKYLLLSAKIPQMPTLETLLPSADKARLSLQPGKSFQWALSQAKGGLLSISCTKRVDGNPSATQTYSSSRSNSSGVAL